MARQHIFLLAIPRWVIFRALRLLFLDETYSTRGRLLVTAQRWPWVSITTARISHGHLRKSFHNAHTFLLNYVTDSDYLHRCILCREISDWRLGQESICKICIRTIVLLFNPYVGDQTVFKSISPKANVIEQPEFELAYYDVRIQYVSH